MPPSLTPLFPPAAPPMRLRPSHMAQPRAPAAMIAAEHCKSGGLNDVKQPSVFAQTLRAADRATQHRERAEGPAHESVKNPVSRHAARKADKGAVKEQGGSTDDAPHVSDRTPEPEDSQPLTTDAPAPGAMTVESEMPWEGQAADQIVADVAAQSLASDQPVSDAAGAQVGAQPPVDNASLPVAEDGGATARPFHSAGEQTQIAQPPASEAIVTQPFLDSTETAAEPVLERASIQSGRSTDIREGLPRSDAASPAFQVTGDDARGTRPPPNAAFGSAAMTNAERSTQAMTQASPEAPVQPKGEATGAAQRQPSPRVLTPTEPSAAAPAQPAVARAAQVDLAVRLENATGQATASPLDQNPQQVAPPALSSSSGASHNAFSQSNLGSAASLLDRANIADDAAFTPQIVRSLSAMVNQRGGVMTMRLDPPDLGELRVQMSISRGVVTADFTAGTQQAHALLDKHMAMLRQALESQGLTVERLTVHAAPSLTHQQSLARDDSGAHQQQHSSWSNKHDAAGSESRGRREHDAQRAWAWQGEEFSLESLLGTDAAGDLLTGSGVERRGAA